MEPYRSPDPSAPLPAKPRGDVDATIATRRAPFKRVLVLFGVLVVLIAILITLLQRAGGAPVGDLAVFVALGCVLLVAVFVVVFYRQIVRLAQDNLDGTALLASGRVDEAIVMFERLAEQSRRFPSYRAQFLANLGTSWLRKGDSERALKYLRAARESRWFEQARAARNHAVLLNALATCHLVRDQIEAARQDQRDAHAVVPTAHRGLLLLGDALIAARAAEFNEVIAVTSSRWSEGEGALGPFQMRALRLVRAFAMSETDADANAREIVTLLDGARPTQLGEFDYLLPRWPAFRDFLVRHEFAAAA